MLDEAQFTDYIPLKRWSRGTERAVWIYGFIIKLTWNWAETYFR